MLRAGGVSLSAALGHFIAQDDLERMRQPVRRQAATLLRCAERIAAGGEPEPADVAALAEVRGVLKTAPTPGGWKEQPVLRGRRLLGRRTRLVGHCQPRAACRRPLTARWVRGAGAGRVPATDDAVLGPWLELSAELMAAAAQARAAPCLHAGSPGRAQLSTQRSCSAPCSSLGP